MQQVLEDIRIAWRSIRANLLRSILTLLIISFGIMAIVGILTAMDTAIYSLSDSLSGLGANTFTIRPKGENLHGRRRGVQIKRGKPISFDQAQQFAERYRGKAIISITLPCTGNATISYHENTTNPNVPVAAIDENYLSISGLNLEAGRNFTHQEVRSGALKAIIGWELVKKLFRENPQKALDQSISIGNQKYKVVGVLQKKGSSMNRNEDLQVFIPLLTGKRFYGSGSANYKILGKVKNTEEIPATIAEATGLMRKIRKLKPTQDNDFEIRKSDNLITTIKEDTTKFRMSAIAIGLITLLGAAIGLMNIMLVSVTERTREIGIRKALGASQRAIRIQFLTEAVLLCQLGGALGIFLGILIGWGVAALLNGPFIIPWMWIFLAISLSFIVGILSGLYPAWKAAGLDPIEALRYE